MLTAPPVHHDGSPGTLCEVCQKPVYGGFGIDGERVCRSFECIRIMKQKHTLPPALFANIFAVQAKNVIDLEEQGKAELRRKTAIDEKISREDADLLNKMQTRKVDPLPPETRLISIGRGHSRMSNLADKRKRAFRDHLNKAISVATSNASHEDNGYKKNAVRIANNEKNMQRLPALEKLTNDTCSQCRGGCCVAGADRAFIDSPLIRRVMADNSDWRPRDVYRIYMDFLPEKNVVGSCVYHTDKGCNLPRNLRSDICNGYLCDSLDKYHKAAVAENELLPALVVSRGYRQFRKYDDGAHYDVVSASYLDNAQRTLIDVENI